MLIIALKNSCRDLIHDAFSHEAATVSIGSIYLSIYLSTSCLSVYLSICLCVCLSVCLCPPACLPACLSVNSFRGTYAHRQSLVHVNFFKVIMTMGIIILSWVVIYFMLLCHDDMKPNWVAMIYSLSRFVMYSVCTTSEQGRVGFSVGSTPD